MSEIDNLRGERKQIKKKLDYESDENRKKNLKAELAEIDRAIKNEEEKNPELKRPRGEDFSYEKGMRRGGEKNSNRYIGRETAERYANIYGSEAAEKRFAQPKNLKAQLDAGMERRAEEERIARTTQERIESEIRKEAASKGGDPPKTTINKEVTTKQNPDPSPQPTNTGQQHRQNPPNYNPNQPYTRKDYEKMYRDELKRMKRQEAYNEIKDFGRVMGKGASSAGRGVGKVTSGIWNFLSPRIKKVGDKEISGVDFLIIIIMIIHGLDIVWLNLNITNNDALFIRGGLHLLILFFAKSVLKENAPMGELWRMWIIPVLLIPLLGLGISNFGTADHLRVFSGALLLFPLWLFYLVKLKGVKASSAKLANLANFYISALIFLTLLYFLSLATQAFTSTQVIEGQPDWFTPQDAIYGAGEYLGGIISTIYESIIRIGPGVTNVTETLLRQSLGDYYTGRVEENKERTGVFIEGFTTRETFYENYPVVISGTLKARSFVENVSINLSCEARDHLGNIRQGTAEPRNMIIYEYDQQAVFCSFSSLPAGSHDITLKADFNFETWAYTTYTFIPRNFLTSLTRGGEDINRKFNINRRPISIYTSGPVSLGMDTRIEMPIAINTNSDTNIPVGITLDNRQGGMGDIQSVSRYVIKIPEYFTLTDGTRSLCTRNITEVKDATLEGYKAYTFKNPSPELVQFYMTVSCNMKLPENNVAPLMRNNLLSAMDVTIVGIAEYDYQLRGRTNIRVREDPVAQVIPNE